jgi:methionyl-tRNA synthetase
VKPFYITTPLYYVNDVPHIGHAYTTIAADVLARWKRLRGEKVFFLTGTDEHGNKIAQAAAAAGQTAQAYADRVAAEFKRLWEVLGITNDDFIRTTEERHAAVVRKVFTTLHDKGVIYKGTYEDWYCTPCETFWSESELNEGKCPTCGRPVDRLQEESYFFKLKEFQEPLLRYFADHPEFMQPPFRASEIVNFVKEFKDLSVSRTKVKWGVPVPIDPNHTVYVWFDALLNYITAAGYPFDRKTDDCPWPADVHFVGKEIFRFHTAIWPAMLMALDIPLPRRVFAHGWWTVEGEKMSKSKGNVVDPHKVVEEFGVDVLRYFLLREVPFGNDGDFSRKALLIRYNAELANALGNLLSRTLNLIEKFNGGNVPETGPDRKKEFAALADKYNGAMDRLAFHEALETIMNVVYSANKFMDQQAPWSKAKTDLGGALQDLRRVLEDLKFIAVLLHPFMPSMTLEMWGQLGETGKISDSASLLEGRSVSFPPGQRVRKGSPLFPRKEAEKGENK